MNKLKINKRQERFCREYVIDHNGKQAAIRSGYKPSGATVQGARMLTNDNVKEYINQLEHEVAATIGITAEKVLKEYAKIAFADAFEHINKDTGDVKADADGALFSQISVKATANGIDKTYRLHNKIPALDVLARYTGLISSSVDLNVTPATEEAFVEAINRIAEAKNKRN